MRRWIAELPVTEGLEGAKGFRPSSQHEVAHRTAPEVFYLGREDCADANAAAELLVGSFQTRRDVDGVAIGRVVEEPAAAEVADNRWTGMNADPCDPQCDPIFVPTFAE